jgi:lipopolysaccharide heptosyltransferase I
VIAEAPRIALVRLSSLGDVVHALPLASTRRAARPAARLTWVVERREAAILREHPALDEVIVADTRGWRRARSAGALAAALRDVRALQRRLAAARFDVAIDAQGLIKSGLLVAATRARVRVGFAAGVAREPLGTVFTTERVTPPPTATHVVDQYLALLDALGITERRHEFPLPASPVAESRADEWLAGVGIKPRHRLVILNPGAGRADKRWPVAHFATLARRLVDDGGVHAVITWGPGEEDLARGIARAGAPSGPGVVLAPPTDLDTLLALLRRASVVVAADTGPLHLAAALGTPCVGLYGPTSAARNGPYGPGHRTLSSDDRTMASLAPDAVLPLVLEMLG